MRQRHLYLGDPHALAQQVDGEAGLGAPARRERPRRLERGPGQAALAVQRLGGTPARRPLDARAGQPDHEAVAAELHLAGEDRDGHVGQPGPHGLGQRSGVRGRLAEIGVEEQQVMRAGRAPAAAAPRSASMTRTASAPVSIAAALPRVRAWRTTVAPSNAASRTRPVARSVVDHDNDVRARNLRRGLDGRADPVGFVPGWDDDGQVAALATWLRS